MQVRYGMRKGCRTSCTTETVLQRSPMCLNCTGPFLHAGTPQGLMTLWWLKPCRRHRRQRLQVLRVMARAPCLRQTMCPVLASLHCMWTARQAACKAAGFRCASGMGRRARGARGARLGWNTQPEKRGVGGVEAERTVFQPFRLFCRKTKL